MADESGVGEVSDVFTDVQPRNRTETDTEVSSDLLESLIEAVFFGRLEALCFTAECVYIVCRVVIKNVRLRRHSWARDQKSSDQDYRALYVGGDLKVDDESVYENPALSLVTVPFSHFLSDLRMFPSVSSLGGELIPSLCR